jgi:hypothetical protein
MALNIQVSIFNELSDFLVSQPDLEALAAYQFSGSIQQRVDSLLERQQDGQLSREEREELDKILLLGDLMNLAKVKAKLKLAGKA